MLVGVVGNGGAPDAWIGPREAPNLSSRMDPASTNPGGDESTLLQRITANPSIFGGKPIIRGRRLAVEHVLGMLAAGDTVEDLVREYPWLEREDVLACMEYARRLVGRERVDIPLTLKPGGAA